MIATIEELCKTSGKSLKALERDLGFGNGTIRRWNTNSPSVDKVQKVADYFGVSVGFILGGEEIKKEASEEAPVDGELAQAIVGMSEAEQQQVLQYIRFLKSQR